MYDHIPEFCFVTRRNIHPHCSPTHMSSPRQCDSQLESQPLVRLHALPASGTTKSQGRHPAHPWLHWSVSHQGTTQTRKLGVQSRHAHCRPLCQTPSNVSPNTLRTIGAHENARSFPTSSPRHIYFSAVYTFTTFLHTHLTDEGVARQVRPNVAMPTVAFFQESC